MTYWKMGKTPYTIVNDVLIVPQCTNHIYWKLQYSSSCFMISETSLPCGMPVQLYNGLLCVQGVWGFTKLSSSPLIFSQGGAFPLLRKQPQSFSKTIELIRIEIKSAWLFFVFSIFTDALMLISAILTICNLLQLYSNSTFWWLSIWA